MIRNLNIILMVTSIIALTGVYVLKFSVEATASQKVRIETRIAEQEGELSLLRADWATLNQPGHIYPIVMAHIEALELAPVAQDQFGSFADLPMRPVRPDTGAMDALFESLAAGYDPIGALIGEN